MPTPFKTDTRWSELGVTADEDDEGRLTISFHFMEMNSAEEVTVSVTARGKAEIGYYIAGMQAAAHALNHKTGGEPMAGGTFAPKTANH